MKNKNIRVSIVEDDDHIRDLYIQLIEKTDGFRCVGGYENAEDALPDLLEKNPDIVLMDINLPGMSGIECTKMLKEKRAEAMVIMLTVYEDSNRIFQALGAGAIGYLLKSSKSEEVIESLRVAVEGGAPMSAQIARKVVRSFRQSPAASKLDELTERENEILSFLASGMLYKEIAAQSFVSKDTVKTHIRNIYRKLQVRTRTEAVVKYMNR